MLRFKVREMMINKEFIEERKILITEVAESTGIHRMTLSKMINKKGCNSTTDNLDKLCLFFKCEIQDIVEYIPD